MKSKKGCMNKGGAAKDRAIEHDVEKESEGDKKFARGGGVMHKKVAKERSVIKAHGHKSMARGDKKSRGGKTSMTPKSPMSGAMPGELPGGGKGVNAPVDKEND